MIRSRLAVAALFVVAAAPPALCAATGGQTAEDVFPAWLCFIMGHPYVQYASIGATVGLVRDALKNGGALRLPGCEVMPDGAKLFRLGFLLAPVAGLVLALAVDHHPMTAALAGWAGPDGLEAFFNARAAYIKRTTKRKGP